MHTDLNAGTFACIGFRRFMLGIQMLDSFSTRQKEGSHSIGTVNEIATTPNLEFYVVFVLKYLTCKYYGGIRKTDRYHVTGEPTFVFY